MARKESQMDQRVLKALVHPLRVRILTLLNQRVASPKELAKETGESLGVVSYHVRILLDLGCIELVGTTPRRGALEHHYRPLVRPWFGREAWKSLPSSARQGLSGEVLDLILSETTDAVSSGQFDANDSRHLSRTPLIVDQEGWDEITDMLEDVLERALKIQAESLERVQKNGSEGTIDSRLVVMHYASGPGSEEQPKARSKGSKGKASRARATAGAAG